MKTKPSFAIRVVIVLGLGALVGCHRAQPQFEAPKFKTLAQKNYYELWKATRDDDLGALQRLIKSDPKLAKVNGSFGTPLHMAMGSTGKPDLIEFLLKHGADPNAFDKDGKTPLFLAVPGMRRATNPRVVELLLAGGANVNFQDKNGGATPLHTAVSVGDLAATQMLLKAGANPNLASKKVGTPLKLVLKLQKDVYVNQVMIKWVSSENYPAIEQALRQAGGK